MYNYWSILFKKVGVTMKTEVVKFYKDRDDVTLTTYVLDDSPELLNGKARPAIIICPGGAYLNCSDREAEPVAMRFAAMGYHAFVLKYSTYFSGQFQMPDISRPLEPKEHTQHPIPMREIGQAILFIKDHAKEWLIDIERVAICGFSAGAHNCAMYANNWHKSIITDYFKVEEERLRPAAVILGYPLSDYIFMKENVANDPMAEGLLKASNTSIIGNPTASKEKLVEISPARNISKKTPPTFIWATSEDNIVPIQHSILLANSLANQKIPFELHIFENGQHGLSLATQTTAQAKSQIMPDVAKWIELVSTWLEKRFSLDLPDLSPWDNI